MSAIETTQPFFEKEQKGEKTMILWVIVLLIQFVAGSLVTWLLWSKRENPWIQRLLAGFWIVNIGLSFVYLLMFTSLGASAYYMYTQMIELAEEIGLPAAAGKLLAWIGAGIGVWGTVQLFSMQAPKRWQGVWTLGGLLTVFCLISAFWGQRNGYAILLDGRAKHCVNPGGLDLESGQRCYPMTAQMIRLLRQSGSVEPLVLEKSPNDPVFFDVDDGEPVRWWCERKDDNCWLARAQIFDPQTGQECEPITPKLIARCNRSRR